MEGGSRLNWSWNGGGRIAGSWVSLGDEFGMGFDGQKALVSGGKEEEEEV